MSPIGYIAQRASSEGQSKESLNCGSSFSVRCDAGLSGALNATAEQISIAIGQTIFRGGSQQNWEFISALSTRNDGLLTTRVWLCHPDWGEPLEIAEIQSNAEKTIVNLAGSQDRRA